MRLTLLHLPLYQFGQNCGVEVRSVFSDNQNVGDFSLPLLKYSFCKLQDKVVFLPTKRFDAKSCSLRLTF